MQFHTSIIQDRVEFVDVAVIDQVDSFGSQDVRLRRLGLLGFVLADGTGLFANIGRLFRIDEPL